MDITVRPAEREDFEALGDLLVDAYRSVPGAQEEPAYWERLRDVAGRADDAAVLVAVDGVGRLLGGVTYVDAGAPFAELPNDDEVEIRMLGVGVGVQGRGVGKALTLACIERARAEGRARVWLATPRWMEGALRLYEGLGFRRVAEHDFTYTDPESGEVIELLVLSRPLS